jgi:hypothetical protein
MVSSSCERRRNEFGSNAAAVMEAGTDALEIDGEDDDVAIGTKTDEIE